MPNSKRPSTIDRVTRAEVASICRRLAAVEHVVGCIGTAITTLVVELARAKAIPSPGINRIVKAMNPDPSRIPRRPAARTATAKRRGKR
jgi:hypothetical protein